MNQLPQHLKKYIVNQNYSRYTAIDHSVWRYILRQLKDFLSRNAHESYLDGLEQTGIEIDRIPSIESVSQKLEKFGWRALPVSGFIPPAAFMELQSLNVLPVASDMRSIDHLTYTPAPDIVHEAAGHAPFLANAEYAQYLREYAQVAKKAILSKEDLNQYEAIRILSDVKEDPNSTQEEIKKAEEKLIEVNNSIRFISEASQLSRMNWWTAEYGLIGDMKNPKIFGAGLLSSVGESKWCLSDKVKKIPLTVDCINQPYDITEPQPQLFVTPDFKTLTKVLHDMAKQMAYNLGGESSLKKAIQAESVNTVQLDSGLQISGRLKKYELSNGQLSYLQFEGPTQLCFKDKEIKGHDKNYHQQGYGTPLGKLKDQNFNSLKENHDYVLNYTSGVTVKGRLISKLQLSNDAFILTFKNTTCSKEDQIYFKPEWGDFDIVTGTSVPSVFGGPADRVAYGEVTDFVAARVPEPKFTETQKSKIQLYQKVRDLRNSQNKRLEAFKDLYQEIQQTFPQEWLLFLEIYEMAVLLNLDTSFQNEVRSALQALESTTKYQELIQEGLRLVHAKN